jgi:hypothetical protein
VDDLNQRTQELSATPIEVLLGHTGLHVAVSLEAQYGICKKNLSFLFSA